ncbi:uncharacterized protein K441DRAFT_182571 [Cenococcum geophilum 1.58]|uniref:uncharacterized protein n=1 Tax=Cenococcum geophilum 1.58 TaxID=794803 RepID=UPI00358E7E64|nr:hypothetical protein K441DRAFT_182571 [Cenococcum geophilum 1.58]
MDADYTIGIEELYWKVAKILLDNLDLSLRILSVAGHLKRNDQIRFPSWIPQWDKLCIVTNFEYTKGDYDATLSSETTSHYIAQRSHRIVEGKIQEAHLRTRGLVVDSVEVFSKVMRHKGFFRKSGATIQGSTTNLVESVWLDTNANRSGISPYPNEWQAFSLTLVAGKGWDEGLAEKDLAAHNADFRLYCLARCSPGFNNLNNSVHEAGKATTLGDADRFLRLARTFCNNRKFFTTAKGRYGLSPYTIQKGDICCVLFGAEIPFILRPTNTKSHYRLVGGCYIHGTVKTLYNDAGRTADRIVIPMASQKGVGRLLHGPSRTPPIQNLYWL